MVYFTVEGKGSEAGALKRAYLPTVDDQSNNIAAAVTLDIKYIVKPYGIAVDWVGRYRETVHHTDKCSYYLMIP